MFDLDRLADDRLADHGFADHGFANTGEGLTGSDAVATAERADVAVAETLGAGRHNPAVRTAGALSEIADQAPSFVACGLVLVAGLASGRPRLAQAGGQMLACVLVAAALKSAVKAVVSRTRPHAVLDGDAYAFEVDGRDGPDDHSFPSGHTAGAVAAARGLSRVYPAAARPAGAAALAVALIQLPRAKHYPADLAAGAAIGLVADGLVAFAAAALRHRLAPDRVGHAPE